MARSRSESGERIAERSLMKGGPKDFLLPGVRKIIGRFLSVTMVGEAGE